VRVAQLSCYLDPARRRPAALLAAWPTLVDVAVATARAGVHVTVGQAAHENTEIKRDDVRFVFVAETPPTFLGRRLGPLGVPMPRRLAQLLRALRPDVIHLQGLSFARQARYLGGAAPNARMLVQDHADHPPRRIWQGIHRHGLARIHGVAFTSADQAVPFFEAGLLRPGLRVFEIPESSSRFAPGDRSEARLATGIHGDPCLLWLANLDQNKDPLCVLDAVRIVVSKLPDVHLWMCYRNAPMLDVVKARLAADPALARRVHLVGKQTHGRIERYLRAADFLVQGSHSEGSGFAVIEALACGTTPLVTDIPSFRAITARGAVGALTRPGDPQAMADAWLDWAGRDREKLRADAHAHFERELSFQALGSKLRNAYTELMRT
jgi:glycosyltransferase involved in cell wall biosynthesis